MFDRLLSTTRIMAFALVAGLGLATQAPAAVINFELDPTSSVTLTDTGGVCVPRRCGVTAALASGFGGTHAVNSGGSATFDFLTFSGRGLSTGTDTFAISAVLKFLSPNFSVTGGGTGGAVLLLGNIVAGVLTWDNYVVQNGMPNVSVSFQGGSTLFAGRSVTTSATISVASVPVPAAGLLMLGGLGGMAAMRRRKARAA